MRKNCGYKNKRDINNPDKKKIDGQIMFEYAYDRPAKKDKADSEKKNPYVSSHNFAVLQQIPPLPFSEQIFGEINPVFIRVQCLNDSSLEFPIRGFFREINKISVCPFSFAVNDNKNLGPV